MTQAEAYKEARAKSIEKWEGVVAGKIGKWSTCGFCLYTGYDEDKQDADCTICPLGNWRIHKHTRNRYRPDCPDCFYMIPNNLSINDPNAIALLQIIRETPETLEELEAEIKAYKESVK